MLRKRGAVKELKRFLGIRLGCSRFRQRLLGDGKKLSDETLLAGLESLQLIVLDFCGPAEQRESW